MSMITSADFILASIPVIASPVVTLLSIFKPMFVASEPPPKRVPMTRNGAPATGVGRIRCERSWRRKYAESGHIEDKLIDRTCRPLEVRQ